MAVYFKNSYKSDGAVLPLSVKNVGFQQCTPGYRWGAGVRDHYLIHYVVSGRGTFTACSTGASGRRSVRASRAAASGPLKPSQ